MQVRARQKEQKKKAIEKCNSERRNDEKWRKTMQIRPETNWTNMISEAKCKNLGKIQETCEKMETALFHLHFSCIFYLHFFLHYMFFFKIAVF